VRGKIVYLFTTLLLFLFFPSIASPIAPEDIIQLKPYYETDRIPSGSDFRLAIEMRVLSGWHINSNHPSNEFAIPTEVKINPPEGIVISEIVFPPHRVVELQSIGGKTEIFDGTSYIIIKGHVDNRVKPDRYELPARFVYQGCSDTICLPPAEKVVPFVLDIVPMGTPVQRLNSHIFSQDGVSVSSDVKPSLSITPDREGDIQRMVAEKGLLVTLFLIFLGGLALNLTPCVYPLIPITISYFGGIEHKGRGFINATSYVLGIAVMYSLLGTAAALSGKMLGTQLTSPIVSIVIASIMVLLALSMFGLYEIRVPGFVMKLAGGEAKTGVTGSFIMGVTMGLVAAPCIGPFVVGLLTYVAILGDPFKGFIMFFFLAIGLGLPYLILGTFSSKLSSLPRSGEWMLGVRRIFGFILLVMAVYFLDPVLDKSTYNILFSLSLVAGGAWLIIFDRSGEKARGFHIIKSIIAIAMIIAGTVFYTPNLKSSSEIHWYQYNESVLSDARNNAKPVVIDFYADWCIPCKELDTLTYSDPRVQKYDGRIVFIKVDLTNDKGEFVQKIKKQYDIKGVPTVVFLGKDGREIKELRLTGFENAESFIKRLEKVLSY
jgi:thiol:disulfide interchange protein DsbD